MQRIQCTCSRLSEWWQTHSGSILLYSCVCDILSSSITLHLPRISSASAFSTAPFLGGRTCINASFQDFPAATSKRTSNTIIQRQDTHILPHDFFTGDFFYKENVSNSSWRGIIYKLHRPETTFIIHRVIITYASKTGVNLSWTVLTSVKYRI